MYVRITHPIHPCYIQKPPLCWNSKGSGSRRPTLSVNNPDKTRQAQIEAAKAKRQRAMEYGNSALKATTRESQLKELKKQVR